MLGSLLNFISTALETVYAEVSIAGEKSETVQDLVQRIQLSWMAGTRAAC